MSLEKSEVDTISRLAAISVDATEVDQLTAKISNVLDLFQRMEAVDTTNVEPMSHPLDQVQRLREDVVTETDHHKQYQKLAPAAEKGMYLVPQVID
ncbi:Asp-tRNA(Asn)/Glu-tRNA(Gln) amidotransferase subunit GatC [Hydrogenovibrio sp. 3SP14C1]|uniref:Asp-tRNA(Asn)/Glu-tRNA(Gln) amidotransferase subunit GatC n=1 Tax=Hydrogenovibrio sp. 3SP14C1 TaxID=3038774 RepID=UPI0024164536|nr:Asp-tRNA(Asn)/Glu-tRNA(Gln) amidotransferase subunit GatC [Hydrogenovibrio sp. 3SP14C1]MDG4812196.1 Asp-tRNA(Asn)/Glu-tRNA(Gln) amidotransferase subunit GatC [Hydrogenovibrio sp. 3SP14C1]